MKEEEKFELLSIQIIKIYLELKVEEYATKINRFKERSHGGICIEITEREAEKITKRSIERKIVILD